jgi:hypothetical protein
MKRAVGLSFLLIAIAGMRSNAQRSAEVHTAGFFESYSFEEGSAFDRLTEVTVPLGIGVPLGRWGSVALSSAWVNVELEAAGDGASETIRGIVDTDIRLSVNVLPGRLMLLAGGIVPTGIETVDASELGILGAIASDVIGLATNELGTGGSAGFGFAGAVPIGQFALGVSSTVNTSFAYQPVSDTTARLRPGNELRVRAGLEGPLARRSYLRLAGVASVSAKDQVDGSPINSAGNRLTGYLSFNQGIASTTLILYGFDVYRSDPHIESTALGAAALPPGNLFGAGLRWDILLGRTWTLTPTAEFRNSQLAPFDEPDAPLELAGRSLRAGIDLASRVSPLLTVVLQAEGLTGFIVDEGERFDMTGFRVALHGELRP